MPKGIYTGMLDVYVAKMTGTDSASSKPTYGAPQVLGMGIEVSITPNYAEGELYASNAVARRAKSIVSYGITINTEAMDPALVAYATGRVKAVSYTHLDVYKRQISGFATWKRSTRYALSATTRPTPPCWCACWKRAGSPARSCARARLR